jgi:putative ABC transport system ATP-binding protein
VIEVRNLWKVYQIEDVVVNALAGVSFEIQDGEFVAIVGSSGSGKSTLMNVLGCLDQPTSGEYYLDGILVNELDDDQLAYIRNRKIGFVFQSYNLLPRLPAVEQVEVPLIYDGSGNRRQRAIEALKAVGLGDRLHHRPTEMSGGQQQRVGIARALVKNPSLILADEPTGNLDSHSTEEILALFETLNRERGITIILVTHEPDVSARADRVITMRDGAVISDVVQKPSRQHEEVRA